MKQYYYGEWYDEGTGPLCCAKFPHAAGLHWRDKPEAFKREIPGMVTQEEDKPAPARADNERLREALRWYEEKVAECRKIGSLGDNARQALDRDGGFRARDALSQQTEPVEPASIQAETVNWKAVANEQKSIIEQLQAKLNAKAEPAPAQAERELVVQALMACDWSNTPIGNKAILQRAVELLSRPAQTEQQPEQSGLLEALDWLDTEVSAIDTWYRGSPSYEHGAGWFKDEVLRLIEGRRAALSQQAAQRGEA